MKTARIFIVLLLFAGHLCLAQSGDYEAADRGDIGKGGLAMTIDRIRLGEGNKQLYGTQYREDPETGRFVFSPLEDPEHVNERRASMGMRPIQEYAERNDITWPIEKINQQMDALTLHGKLTAKPGKGAALASLLLRAADLVSEAKGCRLYLISQDPEAPEDIWVTEVWDSAEDHQASLQIPAVRALIGEAMPLLEGQPQSGQRLTMLGGHGLKTDH